MFLVSIELSGCPKVVDNESEREFKAMVKSQVFAEPIENFLNAFNKVHRFAIFDFKRSLLIGDIILVIQGFLRNNRGINDGTDLPEDYMIKLYESIVFNEIKMKVCPTSASPLVRGRFLSFALVHALFKERQV